MSHDDEIDLSAFADDEPAKGTEVLGVAADARCRRFQLVGVDGAARGLTAMSARETMSVGSHPSNDLVIDDPTVSRFHCEVQIDPRGTWLVDMQSSNGSTVDGVAAGRVGLRAGSMICIGRSTLRFQPDSGYVMPALSERTRCGSLLGESPAMRACFALLERAAAADVTVLLEGETGTGKEGAAEALHILGRRRDEPLLVVDCGAMPATLLESELFGHQRGAFTGATHDKAGIFEDADGGTVFLDEIGELPLELQPKLLRVLEARTIRPLGSTSERSVDVRIVAATNRDLRAEVNEGSFRSDLYFRLAVFKVAMPPLRKRPEDIPLLARHFLTQLDADAQTIQAVLDPATVMHMQRSAWPGNVRELRNYVERCAIMQEALPTPAHGDAGDAPAVDASLPYSEAKRQVLDGFERRYLELLLERHAGNVSQAARAAGMDRVYIYKLLNRHGLKRKKR